MVVSTGMCDMETVKTAYETVKALNPNFCILQCTSTYPLVPSDVHLKCIERYRKEFPDIPIGYSGHEEGVFISVAAVALGAKVRGRGNKLNGFNAITKGRYGQRLTEHNSHNRLEEVNVDVRIYSTI
jgi:hypothetical protein